MDWIIKLGTTWGHIAIGIGIIWMAYIAAHQAIEWYRSIEEQIEQIRKTDGG